MSTFLTFSRLLVVLVVLLKYQDVLTFYIAMHNISRSLGQQQVEISNV